jgi:hypothetical protein
VIVLDFILDHRLRLSLIKYINVKIQKSFDGLHDKLINLMVE